MAIWSICWAVLHRRWRDRQIEARVVFPLGLLGIGLGIVLTFPPVWKLF